MAEPTGVFWGNQHTGGPGPIAVQHKGIILERIAAGELMRDVAASIGITPGAISQVLAKDPEYQAAREIGIEQQLEYWQGEMAAADDQLKLARGRECFRAASWRAEREHPHRWGVKQNQEFTINVAVCDSAIAGRIQGLLSSVQSEAIAASQHGAESAQLRATGVMLNPSDAVIPSREGISVAVQHAQVSPPGVFGNQYQPTPVGCDATISGISGDVAADRAAMAGGG